MNKIEPKLNQPYYSNKDFTLYQGNCVEILELFSADTFDMIFADPPYHLSNGGFTVHAGKRVNVNKGKWDESKGIEEDLQFHLSWIGACKRVLKSTGSIWISGTYHSIYLCGYALQTLGFHLLNDICWYKPNASPNLSCRYFAASHETLLWAKKDKDAKHTFNYDQMKHGQFPDDEFKNDNKQMRSVWSIMTPKRDEKTFGKHPTQKPLELLNRIILASTNEGDVILDPFTGSSTTGLAANINNRKFIGIDVETEYLDLSIKRFEKSIKDCESNPVNPT